MTELQQTPLHAFHVERGAKMVPFAGWSMPVQYPTGVMQEHLHTRAKASLFDVSHMGQLLLRGDSFEDAASALETLTPASVLGLNPWRQRYGVLMTPEGGIVDDFMVSRHDAALYAVVNAARLEEDLALLRQLPNITVTSLFDRGLLALQGPSAESALAALIPAVADMVFLDSRHEVWDGTEVWVSRSGYTGEDGFEISVPTPRLREFAEALLAHEAVALAGLGARDSLRLEAGMPLYGHDLTEETSPLEAGIGFAVAKVRRPGGSRAGGYPGAEVIAEQLETGPRRQRIGLRSEGRAPVREGATIFADDESEIPIGVVDSGGFGPTVQGPIATAMLPAGTAVSTRVFAQLRSKRVPLEVVDLPFVPHHYKR